MNMAHYIPPDISKPFICPTAISQVKILYIFFCEISFGYQDTVSVTPINLKHTITALFIHIYSSTSMIIYITTTNCILSLLNDIYPETPSTIYVNDYAVVPFGFNNDDGHSSEGHETQQLTENDILLNPNALKPSKKIKHGLIKNNIKHKKTNKLRSMLKKDNKKISKLKKKLRLNAKKSKLSAQNFKSSKLRKTNNKESKNMLKLSKKVKSSKVSMLSKHKLKNKLPGVDYSSLKRSKKSKLKSLLRKNSKKSSPLKNKKSKRSKLKNSKLNTSTVEESDYTGNKSLEKMNSNMEYGIEDERKLISEKIDDNEEYVDAKKDLEDEFKLEKDNKHKTSIVDTSGKVTDIGNLDYNKETPQHRHIAEIEDFKGPTQNIDKKVIHDVENNLKNNYENSKDLDGIKEDFSHVNQDVDPKNAKEMYDIKEDFKNQKTPINDIHVDSKSTKDREDLKEDFSNENTSNDHVNADSKSENTYYDHANVKNTGEDIKNENIEDTMISENENTNLNEINYDIDQHSESKDSQDSNQDENLHHEHILNTKNHIQDFSPKTSIDSDNNSVHNKTTKHHEKSTLESLKDSIITKQQDILHDLLQERSKLCASLSNKQNQLNDNICGTDIVDLDKKENVAERDDTVDAKPVVKKTEEMIGSEVKNAIQSNKMSNYENDEKRIDERVLEDEKVAKIKGLHYIPDESADSDIKDVENDDMQEINNNDDQDTSDSISKIQNMGTIGENKFDANKLDIDKNIKQLSNTTAKDTESKHKELDISEEKSNDSSSGSQNLTKQLETNNITEKNVPEDTKGISNNRQIYNAPVADKKFAAGDVECQKDNGSSDSNENTISGKGTNSGSSDNQTESDTSNNNTEEQVNTTESAGNSSNTGSSGEISKDLVSKNDLRTDNAFKPEDIRGNYISRNTFDSRAENDTNLITESQEKDRIEKLNDKNRHEEMKKENDSHDTVDKAITNNKERRDDKIDFIEKTATQKDDMVNANDFLSESQKQGSNINPIQASDPFKEKGSICADENLTTQPLKTSKLTNTTHKKSDSLLTENTQKPINTCQSQNQLIPKHKPTLFDKFRNLFATHTSNLTQKNDLRKTTSTHLNTLNALQKISEIHNNQLSNKPCTIGLNLLNKTPLPKDTLKVLNLNGLYENIPILSEQSLEKLHNVNACLSKSRRKNYLSNLLKPFKSHNLRKSSFRRHKNDDGHFHSYKGLSYISLKDVLNDDHSWNPFEINSQSQQRLHEKGQELGESVHIHNLYPHQSSFKFKNHQKGFLRKNSKPQRSALFSNSRFSKFPGLKSFLNKKSKRHGLKKKSILKKHTMIKHKTIDKEPESTQVSITDNDKNNDNKNDDELKENCIEKHISHDLNGIDKEKLAQLKLDGKIPILPNVFGQRKFTEEEKPELFVTNEKMNRFESKFKNGKMSFLARSFKMTQDLINGFLQTLRKSVLLKTSDYYSSKSNLKPLKKSRLKKKTGQIKRSQAVDDEESSETRKMKRKILRQKQEKIEQKEKNKQDEYENYPDESDTGVEVSEYDDAGKSHRKSASRHIKRSQTNQDDSYDSDTAIPQPQPYNEEDPPQNNDDDEDLEGRNRSGRSMPTPNNDPVVATTLSLPVLINPDQTDLGDTPSTTQETGENARYDNANLVN